MIYYKYNYDYIYTGSVDSSVSVSSATTTPPESDKHIKYNPDTDMWEEIIDITPPEDYINQYLDKAKSYFDDLVSTGTEYDADFESSSYQTQEVEWRLYRADVNAFTPYVDGLAASRGITRDDLMTKIGDKLVYFAYIQGQLHALQDAIKASLVVDNSVATLANLESLPLPWSA